MGFHQQQYRVGPYLSFLFTPTPAPPPPPPPSTSTPSVGEPTSIILRHANSAMHMQERQWIIDHVHPHPVFQCKPIVEPRLKMLQTGVEAVSGRPIIGGPVLAPPPPQ